MLAKFVQGVVMKRVMWWMVGVLVVAMVMPSAWAEREKRKKPKPPAAQPNRPVAPAVTYGKMVRLEGGTFRMGSEEGDSDEKPVHSVTLKPFWLDVTEVTVAAYKACVDAGACKPVTTVNWEGINDQDRIFWSQFCTWGKVGKQNHPINCVDWEQATQFCRWENKRLPTEEEWEYGARQGGGRGDRKYPWGDAEPGPTRLNACGAECVAVFQKRGKNWSAMYSGDDGYPETAPVGSYPLGDTPTGLKDMAGNVWEWTASAYCPYTDDGYDVGECKTTRVNRGGSWYHNNASRVRGASRNRNAPSLRDPYVGFRCARADLFLLFTGPVSDLTSACAIAKGEGEQERHDGRSISTGRRNARKK